MPRREKPSGRCSSVSTTATASSITWASALALDASLRKGLAARLEALVKPPGSPAAPGRPERWNGERSTDYEPLAPKLVVEVAYDHVTDGRFRHGTRFLRWRPDKAPSQCTMEQIAQD